MLHEFPGFGLVPLETDVPIALRGMEELATDPENETFDFEDEFYEMEADFSKERFLGMGDLVQIKTFVTRTSFASSYY